MTSYTPEQEQLIDSLRGATCPACDGPKSPRQSFCRRCYFKLPSPLRQDLYQRIGNGYEDAHAQAMHLLEGGRQ